jgi:hypothetical protein
VTRLSEVDVEKGDLKTGWIPSFTQQSIEALARSSAPGTHPREVVARTLLAESLLATKRGAWVVSNEWNRRLPEVKLIGIEEFLKEKWEGKT